MRDDLIRVEYGTLDDVRSQLLSLSFGLDDAGSGAVAPAASSVTTGAGQFAAQMGDDAQRFVGSWKLFLGAASDDCSIVGNSVGQAKVDFSAVDTSSQLPSYFFL